MGRVHSECRFNLNTRTCDKTRRYHSVKDFYAAYATGWEPLTEEQRHALTLALDEANVYRNGRWVALPDPKPKVLEDVHFNPLEKIFSQVSDLAEKTLPDRFKLEDRTTDFRCRARLATKPDADADAPRPSHKVDAINTRIEPSNPKGASGRWGSARNSSIRIRQTGELVLTADALLTGEFSPGDTRADQFDNIKKQYAHAGHAFYNDVGRIAVFSYTIEKTQMRIWCHTHARTGLTKAFDIHMSFLDLVEFILFSTYASLSVLGVDTTVRRVADSSNNLQYQFDCYAQETNLRTTYETTRCLDEAFAMELYSRSTRVYEVHQVIGDPYANERALAKEPHVLRDYYDRADVKEDPERSIQDGIKRKLESKGIWAEAAPHFMRIKEDGVVRIPVSVDTTVPAPALHEKQHMRTVYEQLCIDLYKVNDPKLFFYAMSQVPKILRYMKLAGYVHRDVSPGNFLLHYLKNNGALPDPASISQTAREDWVTIISDLEFARPYLDALKDEQTPGTPYYAAVEVQHRRYRFRPEYKYTPRLGITDNSDSSDDDEGPVTPPPPHFAYNFYHDAEAALWMALDFVCRRISWKRRALLTSENLTAREFLWNYAAIIFPANSTARHELMGRGGAETRRLRGVLKEVYGADCPVKQLAGLVNGLARAYTTLEATNPSDPSIQFKSGHAAYDPKLFTDEFYNAMEAVFLTISDYYAEPANADVFVSTYDPLDSDPMAQLAPRPLPSDHFHCDLNHDEGDHTVEAGPGNYSDDETGADEEDVLGAHGYRDGTAASKATSEDAKSTTDAAAGAGSEASGTSPVACDAVIARKRKRGDDASTEPQAPARKVRRTRIKGAEPTRRSKRIAALLKSQKEATQTDPAASTPRRRRGVQPTESRTRALRSRKARGTGSQ
ncbi:hypothetical protein EV121DRAFT_205766 [Schizophyllum commune]